MENLTIADRDLAMEESLEKIIELVLEKKYFLARDELLKYNAVDIAELLEEVMEDVGIQAAVILFRLLPKDVSVDVFSELPSDDQVEIVSSITDREIHYIVQRWTSTIKSIFSRNFQQTSLIKYSKRRQRVREG